MIDDFLVWLELVTQEARLQVLVCPFVSLVPRGTLVHRRVGISIESSQTFHALEERHLATRSNTVYIFNFEKSIFTI